MLKEIVVHFDGSQRSEMIFRVGAALSSVHGSRVVAVFVNPPVSHAVGIPEPFLTEYVDHVRKQQRAAAAMAEESFRENLNRVGGSGEWRVQTGHPAMMLAINGRYADLLVVGQTPPDRVAVTGEDDLPEQLVLDVGRPVLVVPNYGTFETVGERVVVAWDAGRAATRAVKDAMPLLVKAREVTVLTVNPETSVSRHGEAPGADIALYLARHGVKAKTEQSWSSEVETGDLIMSRAYDLGADLVVMGAYGHSRLREVLLGGVTRRVLAHMTKPVLMSH